MEEIKMGFFSELKSDLSQAVNTLMPEEKPDMTESLDDNKAKEEPKPADLSSMLDRLDDIKLDEISEEKTEEEPAAEEPVAEEPEAVEPVLERFPEVEEVPAQKEAQEEPDQLEKMIEEQTEAEIEKIVEEPKNALEAIDSVHINKYVADKNAETEKIKKHGGFETMDFENQTPTDEVASITEGMVVNGDLQTTGSLELIGKITGNIKCLGKLNVTGEIAGDSDAAEIYAESARITGEVRSKGSVKVGQSTVIVGNIYGSSAVIAGAVKGDIDVHGPVVLDTTAIVMGNIKSQSVQINNGAVIEGMCSQAYADVNPSEFFEGLKNK